MIPFNLQFIDHVAIRVQHVEVSKKWYSEVLGFVAQNYPLWGEHPIFMASGNFAIALFPAGISSASVPANSKYIKIDHFAFRVDETSFKAALLHFSKLGIPYSIQDHHYYESVYIHDPDGHCVELTRLVKQ